MTGSEPEQSPVRGERDAATLHRARSVQSRMSSVLAITLMSVVGLGMLSLYYANALSRQSRTLQSARSLSASRAQGEMPLPSLGRMEAPLAAPDLIASPTATTLREIPLQPSAVSAANGAPPLKTVEQLAVDRQLSGTVYAQNAAFIGAASQNLTTAALPGESPGPASGRSSLGSSADASPERGELNTLLRSSESAAVRAQVLPAQRLLLPKGAFIDCTLETAIDSTLPGMTTCVVATDTFGVNGQVVLLERGTKLIGETRGQVAQGSARVFVLWTEARTPTGVIVPLASPGTDELGRSGLAGVVNHHFFERFGAAILVSIIDGVVQSAVQSSRSGNGAVIVNPYATQGVLTEVLKGTINIPPTVAKQQGDRIQVLVARDLDFRSVYALR